MITIVYVIADVHLSQSVQKPMHIFGAEWDHHELRLQQNWINLVKPDDTVFLPGDISWGIDLSEAMADFRFLHALPGKKIVSKGNHDYWWSSVGKMKTALAAEGLTSIDFLHNNAWVLDGMVFCGTKGYLWDNEQTRAQNQKLHDRECARLKCSLMEGLKLRRACGMPNAELVVLLHYPPITILQRNDAILELMNQYDVRRCYYGHIHGPGKRSAVIGPLNGLDLTLISADYLGFSPLAIK